MFHGTRMSFSDISWVNGVVRILEIGIVDGLILLPINREAVSYTHLRAHET